MDSFLKEKYTNLGIGTPILLSQDDTPINTSLMGHAVIVLISCDQLLPLLRRVHDPNNEGHNGFSSFLLMASLLMQPTILPLSVSVRCLLRILPRSIISIISAKIGKRYITQVPLNPPSYEEECAFYNLWLC